MSSSLNPPQGSFSRVHCVSNREGEGVRYDKERGSCRRSCSVRDLKQFKYCDGIPIPAFKSSSPFKPSSPPTSAPFIDVRFAGLPGSCLPCVDMFCGDELLCVDLLGGILVTDLTFRQTCARGLIISLSSCTNVLIDVCIAPCSDELDETLLCRDSLGGGVFVKSLTSRIPVLFPLRKSPQVFTPQKPHKNQTFWRIDLCSIVRSVVLSTSRGVVLPVCMGCGDGEAV
ncbi:hypothetical protein BJ878DRAFT_93147 [Calycina marina]|uniref:Uncharacterized protein n=1 Tax=Calycina marina TaxID=1763456 RepID=A0A9P7Z9I4_9HELO|nr:hypothetical protein BJ878DRAFT_93147 [Calycina marina]